MKFDHFRSWHDTDLPDHRALRLLMRGKPTCRANIAVATALLASFSLL